MSQSGSREDDELEPLDVEGSEDAVDDLASLEEAIAAELGLGPPQPPDAPGGGAPGGAPGGGPGGGGPGGGGGAGGEVNPHDLDTYDLAPEDEVIFVQPPEPAARKPPRHREEARRDEARAPRPTGAEEGVRPHMGAAPAPAVSTSKGPEEPKDVAPEIAARKRAELRKQAAYLEALEDQRRRRRKLIIAGVVVLVALAAYLILF